MSIAGIYHLVPSLLDTFDVKVDVIHTQLTSREGL